ncbi:MAG: AtpZ/AtpI family protein [Rhodospirillaceae bacterium]|nr:AtpZ/AtpI family protein [Rhodospirillaceae bacterium]
MADQDPDEPTDFEARLKAAREKAEDNSGPVPSRLQYESSSAGLGFRMGIELMVGLVVGLGIGWLLDGWLDTKPLFMIVLMILGMGAGILNVVRASKQLDKADTEKK